MVGAWLLISLIGFTLTLVVSAVLVPLVRDRAEALKLMDAPNLDRKQHDRPIPRTGGVGIFPAFWLTLWGGVAAAVWVVPGLAFLPEQVRTLGGNVGGKLVPLAGLFAGALMIFVLGVLDDRFNLPPLPRLAIQILACVPVIATGTVLKLFMPPIVAVPVTILWLVLLTNSFNFLDNMNGLTSGVSAIICLVMAMLAFLAREWFILLVFVMLAGAVVGFWRYNFPKASVFLGDAGSTHLGFLIGCLAILSTYWQEGTPSRLPILIPVLVLGVPLFDTLSVLWIRWRAGKPLMQGDTNHVSHRLVALGMSRTEAVVFLYGATLVVGLAAIPLRQLDTHHGVVLAVAILLIFFMLHWLERVSYRRIATITSTSDRGSR